VVNVVERDAASEPLAASGPRAPTPQPQSRGRSRSLDRATVATLVLGLVLTVALAGAARNVRDRNESVLLRQRVREAGAVLKSAIPNVQLPMSSAAVLAEATGGNVDAFRRLFVPLVGTGKSFISATLWPVGSLAPRATVGVTPELTTLPPARWRDFFEHSETTPGLSVLSLLNDADRRLGYAITTAPPGAHYVVYVEAALPKSGRLKIASDSAFSDFGYALYIGSRQSSDALLYASERDKLPLAGRHASTSVPFGDTNLLLVVKPRKALGGSLMERLPWILLVSGIALTLLAALLVERLARRRKDAERLARELNAVAAENARLYEQQRDVAETLQHSLLPDALPQLRGVHIAGRFAAGTPGLEIGGDWYDVLETGPERCMFVVGDVSGRGVRAGTIMAKLRYSARAYAVAGDTPQGILDKLSKLVSLREGHFATVLCGVFDASARRLVIANAGHLPAMLAHDGCVTAVAGTPGVPIGVTTDIPYAAATVELPERGTLLAFTDGLVERRGECLDVGLERVATLMQHDYPTLDEFLDVVLDRLQDDADDDTAMLGLQWNL
jgi:serine phosphatase RsbU (regulator of sigma subunit)